MYSGGVWFNGPRFLYLQCLQFLVSGFFGPFAIKNSNDFCLASLQVGSQLLGNHSTARDGRTAGRDEAHLGGGLHVSRATVRVVNSFLCASVQLPDFGDLQSCCLPTDRSRTSFCEQIYRKYRYFASIKRCFICRS